MPNVEIDGTNSTVKTNVLTSQSGTTITVPTGKVLTVTDAAGLTVNGVAPLTSIANDAVTTAKIINDAVTTAKIINNAVDETKLKDALIADFTEVVVTASDSLLLSDATDSGNTKRDTVQGILDLAVHTGNVAFPATQVASANVNTLDDYEEGSWTPVYSDGSNLATMDQWTSGRYTKIGDLVYAVWQSRSTTIGSMSGTVQLNGLPFTSANNTMYPAASLGYFHHVAITAGYSILGGMNPNSTSIGFRLNDNTVGVTGLTTGEASSDMQMFGSITYKSV